MALRRKGPPRLNTAIKPTATESTDRYSRIKRNASAECVSRCSDHSINDCLQFGVIVNGKDNDHQLLNSKTLQSSTIGSSSG
ncbi:hypothetical protein SynMITS9220_00820 [Synechococcus sp. MIT S9220]|nr:hypothetical protein SynMITS9220_00820 [Synechococcus sp. MIT S9220]